MPATPPAAFFVGSRRRIGPTTQKFGVIFREKNFGRPSEEPPKRLRPERRPEAGGEERKETGADAGKKIGYYAGAVSQEADARGGSPAEAGAEESQEACPPGNAPSAAGKSELEPPGAPTEPRPTSVGATALAAPAGSRRGSGSPAGSTVRSIPEPSTEAHARRQVRRLEARPRAHLPKAGTKVGRKAGSPLEGRTQEGQRKAAGRLQEGGWKAVGRTQEGRREGTGRRTKGI